MVDFTIFAGTYFSFAELKKMDSGVKETIHRHMFVDIFLCGFYLEKIE